MTTASGRFAVLAALGLAGVMALVPAAPTPAAEPVEPGVAPGDRAEERPAPPSIFAGTAIGVVLEANGNEVPKNGKQMMKALAKLGEFSQLPVTFSAVDLTTGLSNPRVVVVPRPSLIRPGAPPVRAGKPPVDPDDLDAAVAAALGAGGPAPVQAVLHPGKLTAPNLDGRLFLAANFEKKDGALKVKTFEFISWNGRKQRFDFGFIECDEVEPQIRLVDGVKCFSCHKNKGPILGQGPWSNTPHNDLIRGSVLNALIPNPGFAAPTPAARANACAAMSSSVGDDLGQPRRLDTGFLFRMPGPGSARTDVADGLSIVQPQGPAVDAAVRLGGDLARDRDIYRSMARSNDGRKGLVILLSAIAAPGPLEQTGAQVRGQLDQTYTVNFMAFTEKWVALHKSNANTLIDFNPSGSVGVLQTTTGSVGGWGGGSTLQVDQRIAWNGDPKQITDYNQKRADGDHGLPSVRQPSNPKAFVRPVVNPPVKPSAAVNAISLARLIGVTEGDRAFLADHLAVAARQIDKPKVTPAALAKEVFGGPQFAEVLNAGEIPDREDFKDRFVKGLNEVLKGSGTDGLKLARADYASGPNVAHLPGKEEKELPVVATTACVRCHDVRGVGKAAFSPIPALAFDPFDKASRETWVRANPDAKKRLPVLARVQKRIDGDRDMPPEDSAEYDTFRMKTPGAFDAMREWLDAELKRAKGG